MPEKNRPTSTTAPIDTAHRLYAVGDKEQARILVEQILAKEPNHLQAQGLRDRIDNEDFSVALIRERDSEIEDGDESPAVSVGLLVVAIASALGATILAIKYTLIGMKVGFATEVIGQNSLLFHGKSKYPVQIFFMYPAALYIISAIAFYAYRRYARKR